MDFSIRTLIDIFSYNIIDINASTYSLIFDTLVSFIYNLAIFMRTYIKSDGTSGSYLGEAIILRQCALVKRNLN